MPSTFATSRVYISQTRNGFLMTIKLKNELFIQLYSQEWDVLVKVKAEPKKLSCTTKIVSRVTIS